MRNCLAIAFTLTLWSLAFSQQKPPAIEAVTVPAVIDHNRVIVEVEVQLQEGKSQRVRAWVDNGNPDLIISQRLAEANNRGTICEWQTCGTSAPAGIVIGGMEISFQTIRVKGAKFTVKQDHPYSPAFAGVAAEMNIPSTVLRNYDVLIDFPGHKFTIGPPGSIHFLGSSAKVQINAENGLIQVPSQIERKKYNLALDMGSCISFLSGELFDTLASAHPDWPRMTGAVGSANMWGMDEEAKWKVMRLDRLQYGPLFLTDVAVVALPKTTMEFFEKRAGMPTAGLLGSNELLNYRVGLDYAHSTVYFDIGRLFNFPDFDVIGVTLRPEDDGGFTIVGVADFNGQLSVASGPYGVQAGDQLIAVDGIPVRGSTMGQVWSMMGGTPGQERKLTIERTGKEFVAAAKVQHFLGAVEDKEDKKKKH